VLERKIAMIVTMSVALLILRLVAGLTLAAHGAQKLFGWFGGSGFGGTVKMQERMGFKPAWLWAGLVILGEFGGGLSLAFGFLTPLGAAGALGAMFMAIVKAHWKNGFWNSKRGLEFPLQLLAAAVAIGFAGPGSYSLDALFGIALPTPLLFLILALVALLVDIIGLVISRIPLIRAEVGSHTS
jgi:putative oxidoreductase